MKSFLLLLGLLSFFSWAGRINFFPTTSSWTPASVSGLKLWLTAKTGVTSSGGIASAWADQSGNGNNFSAGNTGPTVNASGLNGRQTLTFNGTGKGTSGATMIGPSTSLIDTSSAFTVVFITRPTMTSGAPSGGGTGEWVLFAFPWTGSAGMDTYVEMFYAPSGAPASLSNNTNYWWWRSDKTVSHPLGISITINSGSTFTPTNYKWLIQYNGSGGQTLGNYTMALNGSGATISENDFNDEGSTPAQISGFGSTGVFGYSGEVAAIYMWQNSFAAGDITNLNTYLSNEWGL